MRYTTLIDITEYPQVWRSESATRLYILLTLKCGYHDDDRDRIRISLHTMEAEAGLSFSAVRHALKILMKAGLLVKDNEGYRVVKWCLEKGVTPRPKQSQAKAFASATDIGRQMDEQREELRRKRAHAVQECSREELQTWIEELEKGQVKRHFGTTIIARQDWIDYMKSQLKKK